jgi:hypothetical protein
MGNMGGTGGIDSGWPSRLGIGGISIGGTGNEEGELVGGGDIGVGVAGGIGNGIASGGAMPLAGITNRSSVGG